MMYSSQRVAYPYFIIALLLFGLQIVMGLWLALQYFTTIPQEVVDAFPFSTARAMHTNLLVLWLLLGFMGATYYLVPEETKSELASPKVAIIQLVLLTGTGVAALVGFLFGWTQGRPLLEIPRPLDVLIVIGVLMFLANVGWTMIKAKNWTATQGALLGGLTFLAVMYLFGIPFYRNISVDWYYWWWVIHLWVEGAWELIAAAMLAFILIKMTGVERSVVEKWLYVELGLFLFTGIAGTGHHYYWLGAPRYWLYVGGIFSALEPLPIVLMRNLLKRRKTLVGSPSILDSWKEWENVRSEYHVLPKRAIMVFYIPAKSSMSYRRGITQKLAKWRKEESIESDTDICFVYFGTSHREMISKKIEELSSSIKREYGATISPFFISLKGFKRKAKLNQPPINEILKDGIVLYGKSIKVLTNG